MYRKAFFASFYGPLFGLILAIGGIVVAAYVFGLRIAPEHRLIDAGLALVALLALAWPSVMRRGALLHGASAAGAYSMRVHEPRPVAAGLVEEWSRIPEEAQVLEHA